MRDLVVCCDGTWQDATDRSNVIELYERLDLGPAQKKYVAGVGTGGLIDRVRGGIVGWGIDRDLLEGYRFLVEQFSPDDRISLFGFSRGAYLARSLAGMVGRIGIVDRTALEGEALEAAVAAAYGRYTTHKAEFKAARRAGRDSASRTCNRRRAAAGVRPPRPGHPGGPRGCLGRGRRTRHPEPSGASGPAAVARPLRVPGRGARPPDPARPTRGVAGRDARAVPAHALGPVRGGRRAGHRADVVPGRPLRSRRWARRRQRAQRRGTAVDDRAGRCRGRAAVHPPSDQSRPDQRDAARDVARPLGVLAEAAMQPRPRATPPVDAARPLPHLVHASAYARQQATAAGPRERVYRPTRTLGVGETAEVVLEADRSWNATGLYLEPGAYRFAATGRWGTPLGGGGPSGAAPWPVLGTGFARAVDLVEQGLRQVVRNPEAELVGARREADAPLMALVGLVGNEVTDSKGDVVVTRDGERLDDEKFVIGDAVQRTVTRAGYLWAYGNDAWGSYGNNHGQVDLAVQRLQKHPATDPATAGTAASRG